MNKQYRELTDTEIETLKNGGCSAHEWSDVLVSDGFDVDHIKNTHFGGEIRLGAGGGWCAPAGSHKRKAGIYNASLYNCTVGDNVYISNIGRYISGYDIADDVVIENVGELSAEEGATFGYGVKASVINEAGGREIPLCAEMTAQTAYITAMYRHRAKTIKQIYEMVDKLTKLQAAGKASVGEGSKIVNCTTIKNINIGRHAVIDGALSLNNGTIRSSEKYPAFVGSNVSAKDFIILQSGKVDTGAMLRQTFVGEGVVIENGFSSENSAFFANSHLAHGESCAVFGGPFTVSHHRSTLLIAGYFSFFNAGSGANQSNHMYKSGPVHQGVHLRGCKFSSDAYLMLPARTGVFSIIKGRHYSHHDTEDMPFSYLIEENGDSVLYPAMNLRSYGTARDVIKWPNRDHRGGIASDIINYEMMSPYSGARILKAIEHTDDMLTRHPLSEVQLWKRVKIRTSQLKRGLTLYQQALRSYIAPILKEVDVTRLRGNTPYIRWVDLAGMIAPKARVDAMLDRIDDLEIDSFTDFRSALEEINSHYAEDTQVWALYAAAQLMGKEMDDMTQKDVDDLIKLGEKDAVTLQNYINNDAVRDSAPLMAVGYGIDCEEERDEDFRQVRGN